MAENRNQELYPGWKTVRKIGSGSFGTVYEIQRDLFGRIERAALKCISIPHSESDVEELYSNGYDEASITAHFENYLANIVREYSLMVEMKGHTNVVYCDDIRYVRRDDGIGWDITIKMELLTPLLKTLGPGFREAEVIRLGKDLCRALALCKDRDIVHRDIKPQNIFVSNTGDYKLGDFGIAKTVEQTTGGTRIGTYSYMAPEVYHNKPYGSASDIYSLGLVMYWLLNERRLPFLPLPPQSPTYQETENARHRRFLGEKLPLPLNGSEGLKRIVMKACAFDPQDRYATAREMLEDLENLDKAQPAPIITAAPPQPGEEGTALLIDEEEGTALLTEEEEATALLVEEEEEGTALLAEEDDATVLLTEQKPQPPTPPKPVAPPKTQTPREEPPKKPNMVIFAVAAVAVLLIVGYLIFSQYHIWTDATCTNPAVCQICGKTKGGDAEHQWKEATCTAPQFCVVCGRTEGAPLGHDWVEGSGEASCSRCGETKEIAVQEDAPVQTGPVREITWVGVQASSTYDGAHHLSGFLLECMFQSEPADEEGFTADISFQTEDGHDPFYVDSGGYMYCSFWIPNDPALEGWHTVTLHFDGTSRDVEFCLQYLGDYSDVVGTSGSVKGLGWTVSEWKSK